MENNDDRDETVDSVTGHRQDDPNCQCENCWWDREESARENAAQEALEERARQISSDEESE